MNGKETHEQKGSWEYAQNINESKREGKGKDREERRN